MIVQDRSKCGPSVAAELVDDVNREKPVAFSMKRSALQDTHHVSVIPSFSPARSFFFLSYADGCATETTSDLIWWPRVRIARRTGRSIFSSRPSFPLFFPFIFFIPPPSTSPLSSRSLLFFFAPPDETIG